MCPSSLKTSDSTRILATGQAKLWMLLVGVNHYQDDHFPVLDYSAADCQGLGEALTAATQEFPQKQVMQHHDFAAQPPTLSAVYASLKQITTAAQPQDTVLFYFSGHGVIESTQQQPMLCLSDTRNQALLETALSMEDLLNFLESCEAHQQLVWLDACHSGGLLMRGARGPQEPSIAVSFDATAHLVHVLRSRASQTKGFYALLSCDRGQRSWEFPELGHGLFTYYLIQGIQGEAADAEGVIEADALYRYVYLQTLNYIHQKNKQLRQLNEERKQRKETPLFPEYPLQTPKRIVEGVGELVIGLKPQPATSPSPSPIPDPEAMTTAPNSPVLLPSETMTATLGSPDLGETTASPTGRSSPSTELPSTELTSTELTSDGPTNAEPVSPQSHQGLRPRYSRYGVLLVVLLALAASGVWLQQAINRRPTQTGNANSAAANGQACNIQAQAQPAAAAPTIEAQIVLTPCEAGQAWQQLTVETLTGEPDGVWAMALSPDGNMLASASGAANEVWDLHSRQRHQLLAGHSSSIYAVAISPDGQFLASSGADQTIRLWDLRTGTLVRSFTGHTAAVWSVAFSTDGRTLASGSADQTIKLWDVQTGTLIRSLTGHQNWVFAVAFSPDGQTLASASKDATVKLWNWRSGQLSRTLSGHRDTVRAIAFDPTGQRLASASWDRTVMLWDTQTGTALKTLTGHSDRVVAVAFSPDGKTLASGSVDQTIKLWDLNTFSLFATLYGHADWVLSLAFSPNGKALFSSSRDRTIAIWRH